MTPGQRGEAVRDLQRRLGAAGFLSDGVEAGFFCARTERGLAAFQADRGLAATGRLDDDSWRALVEASWSLGDRLLLHVAPNLRGDDISELQGSLARLGFDSGRVDGIFGPATARALEDFQQNSGLYVDGVCGPDTVRALQVLLRQTGTGPGIAAVRELEALTATARSLSDLRVVVGQFGGLSGLSRQLIQSLRHRSANVIASDEPDAHAQAQAANEFGATVYIGFEARVDAAPSVHYYAVPQFESAGGHALASRIALACEATTGQPHIVSGTRLSILRETRMPAVLFVVGDAQWALDDSLDLVRAIVDALEQWAVHPLDL